MTTQFTVYKDNELVLESTSMREVVELKVDTDGIIWIDMVNPDSAELHAVAEQFRIPELPERTTAIPVAIPRFDRVGDRVWCAFPVAQYDNERESIKRQHIHLHMDQHTVISVRESDNPHRVQVCEVLRSNQRANSTRSISLTLLAEVIKGYVPVLEGLETDIDQVEVEVFSGHEGVTERTYNLAREIIEFQRAVRPLQSLVDDLSNELPHDRTAQLERALSREAVHRLEDVDRRIDSYRALLQNILSVNLSLTGLRQNESMKRLTESSLQQGDQTKRISSWAAILFAPTLVGTVYGMNFVSMPELDWRFGYPLALLLMLGISVVMFVVFKGKGWLD